MTWNTQLSSSSSSSNTEFEFGKSGRDLEHPVKWWWWWWCRAWAWKKCVLSENRPTTQIRPDGSVQLGEKLGYFHRSHTKVNGFWRDTGSSENMGKLKWNKRLLEGPYRKCLWCTSFLIGTPHSPCVGSVRASAFRRHAELYRHLWSHALLCTAP